MSFRFVDKAADSTEGSSMVSSDKGNSIVGGVSTASAENCSIQKTANMWLLQTIRNRTVLAKLCTIATVNTAETVNTVNYNGCTLHGLYTVDYFKCFMHNTTISYRFREIHGT